MDQPNTSITPSLIKPSRSSALAPPTLPERAHTPHPQLVNHMTHTPPKELQALLAAEPDFVDRIFDYLLSEFPQLAGDAERMQKAQTAVRAEFAGEEVYIQKRSSRDLASEVLQHFNGRNASEVARRLGVSRRTVYRHLKQPGK